LLVSAEKTADFVESAGSAASPAAKMLVGSRRWWKPPLQAEQRKNPAEQRISTVRGSNSPPDGYAVFSNSSRPISMRLISLVPAPIS
jgi:hypothetical protein